MLTFGTHIGTGYATIAGLLGFFVIYKVMDKRLNKAGNPAPLPPGWEGGSLAGGSVFLVVGVLVILLAGKVLSNSTGALIKQLDVPAWAVGWILGLVTSVCELAAFIEIYRTHKHKDSPRHIKDTQEAIDALGYLNPASRFSGTLHGLTHQEELYLDFDAL